MRPIVRPIAGRLRMFLVGRLHDEMAEIRAELRMLREAIDRERPAEDQVREVMAQALATLALERDVRR